MLGFFLPFFKKALDQLIDTGPAYFEKLDDLCALVPSFEMSKGQQSYFHLNGFLLTCELFKVDIKDVMMVV
ncbi:hypothetical protein FP742_08660 [Vibrio parahaemolyticus]|uniref:Uncharacterized protein n=3 Tax=Vibrio parahaemolyticus TaxID=670 RepID=A0A0L8U3Y2_VIBPH|nr:hypothetical protein [Vibrio parahaemolyticus]EFO37771.1 conserved hypothetical protein [Vibrio parahaemolyticus Peru-466]EFO43807.1 conserved hypothetical protein [Vibrio parahaemolyticus AN-5034]EFO50380.1 conserved hypothetical protein [Vibrio parahaemolyticus K5030]EQL92305.1 hypothetical protein D036_4578 [Vibrio parahaemolyticus VP232]EQL93735.1 hypothetical protein D035_0061 [Vibrio parahaemolyticus VP250]EQL98826.1 hypothetical protein D040_4182 [Vibrio parahaemolyticus NIHCB0603]